MGIFDDDGGGGGAAAPRAATVARPTERKVQNPLIAAPHNALTRAPCALPRSILWCDACIMQAPRAPMRPAAR
eukprot:355290-Chlamydomonas_euryale.AAC.1